jgi:hypothetical protein
MDGAREVVPTVVGRGGTDPDRAGSAASERGRVHRDDAGPRFATPGAVLLAAAAILEGYRWLQFIPDGSLRASEPLFVVAALPATYALTRHVTSGWAGGLRWVAIGCAAMMPVLGVAVVTGHPSGWGHALGLASLLLALSILTLSVAAERRGPSTPRH